MGDFGKKVGYEVLAGALAASVVSPFITIVDKSITANASGRQQLLDGILSGLKLLMNNPMKFVRKKEFLIIWGVYSGNYATANVIEAACHEQELSHYYPKFVGTSIA